MTKLVTLHDALALAYEMHAGVTDWTGVPYITHPVWVMLRLPETCSDEDRQIALLHDVVEDCQERLCEKFDITPDYQDKELKNIEELFVSLGSIGYSDYVIQGVKLLTRDLWRQFTYINYVRNIISSGHFGAIWVKYADNLHNTDPNRSARLPEEDRERWLQMQPRYERSKKILRESLNLSEQQ